MYYLCIRPIPSHLGSSRRYGSYFSLLPRRVAPFFAGFALFCSRERFKNLPCVLVPTRRTQYHISARKKRCRNDGYTSKRKAYPVRDFLTNLDLLLLQEIKRAKLSARPGYLHTRRIICAPCFSAGRLKTNYRM